jgi:outer membrane protein
MNPARHARMLAALAALAATAVPAAEAARDARIVAGEYVAIALQDNLALQGQDLEVERAALALDAARARFFPELALQARYTRADGGRQFEVPLGTLLNPAYQTLNELLEAHGEAPRFSPLPDQTIPFQREREQDTRITLRQPLYQPAIPAAARAQRETLRGARAGEEALKQRLRRDVWLGYLDWLKALRAREVLVATAEVLDENLRIGESLLANGRVTEDQVLRARTEQLAVAQQLRETTFQIGQARSYVNFLLNRPLETALEDAPVPAEAMAPLQVSGGLRPELEQADAFAAAAGQQHRAARAALKPSVSLGIDAGTQGEDWDLGPGYNYASASLVFSWKFFDGGANRAEAERARLGARQARLQQESLLRQINLEQQQARDRLAAASDSIGVAEARAEAARAAQRIAERKRDAGAISQVEFLDAHSALTAAELALNVNRFELLQRRIELQYAAGDVPGQPANENRELLP